MKIEFSQEELWLLRMLEASLKRETYSGGMWKEMPKGLEWREIMDMAQAHGVLPLLYDVLEICPQLPEAERKRLTDASRQTVQQTYHLLFLTSNVVRLLEQEGITVLVLKGVGTAALYPVPELRKSGDVDILVPEEGQLEKACRVLEQNQFRIKEEQKARHHIVCTSPEGISVEIHLMLAEPFDNERANAYLEREQAQYKSHVEYTDTMGITLPILDTPYHAWQLLLHMLQHFLRTGFGLKLLCDWAVFWNREIPNQEKQEFLRLVTESRTVGFARCVSAVCVRYLGLSGEKVDFLFEQPFPEGAAEEFLKETLEAEEFGKAQAERMVVMRGDGLLDYAREFHHQMRLNYPKAGKNAIFWPVLWLCTLIVFLYNNRKKRKVSSIAVLKKARKRSRLMKEIKLFCNVGKQSKE